MADSYRSPGTLWGLGVGPGDPELITLKALKLLRASPVVAYPAPEDGPSLARAIAAPHIAEGKVEIAIRMPLEAGRFPSEEVYDRAAATIAGHLEAGRDVAALCEGDPFFYGSFMYLFARLAGRFGVEVVPGVSSLVACPAALGAPLAARNDTLVVLPAPLPEERLRDRLREVEAAAIIKVGRHLGKVRRVVDALGLMDRARYVEHATMAGQRTCRLARLDADAAPYFSMVLVHRRGEAWR
ncbi:MAG: precorrin-2 C(20)-methyltransferase [Alphaproteobacteria bacterium]